MKRLGIIMLAAWISAALLAGCEKHAADAPDFPLEKQAIEEALETMGLQYTVEEDSKLREMLPGFTSFNLYSEEGNSFIAGIKSGDKDGEKMLSLVLLTTGETNVPVEDGRNMVVLATRLYGGFEEETCVYDQFQKEFPTDNTQRQHEIQVKNATQIKEELVWKATFAEAECQIKVKRPNIDEPLEYINVISFATNWETFF